MDGQYLQHVRYKLQKRFRRVNAAQPQLYHSVLRQFWTYLHHSPVFVGILDTLHTRVPDAKEIAEQIEKERRRELPVIDEEVKWAAASYWIIKQCSDSDDSRPEINITTSFSHSSSVDERYRLFTEIFVEPLYEYLDEALDDRGAILALLRKYKQKYREYMERVLDRLIPHVY